MKSFVVVVLMLVCMVTNAQTISLMAGKSFSPAIMIEDVVDAKIRKELKMPEEFAEKTLLLPKEVCQVLRISKTTLYELGKEVKLKGFKIQRRRYFARTDVERLMRRQF